jgi:hypothetical protein
MAPVREHRAVHEAPGVVISDGLPQHGRCQSRYGIVGIDGIRPGQSHHRAHLALTRLRPVREQLQHKQRRQYCEFQRRPDP